LRIKLRTYLSIDLESPTDALSLVFPIMAKAAKRMSDMFASSTEQPVDTTMATASPPYSSEGPTLPTLESSLKANPESHNAKDARPAKTSKTHDQDSKATAPKQATPQREHTTHPSLYEPWTLLPPQLLELLEAQARLRTTQNVILIVFTKNQNVKTGINKLKTYLGAYRDPKSTIEMPDALKQDDVLIAVSAQGDGTIKLVSIVDLARKIVAPGSDGSNEAGKVEKWYMYTVLTHIEVEPKSKTGKTAANEDEGKGIEESGEQQDADEEEEEAFEPMDVDEPEDKSARSEKEVRKRKVPVLTVWMTRKSVPAFASAFGEQVFSVQALSAKET
jgi:hypothetical protein